MFDLTNGPQRDLLLGEAAERFLSAGCLVVDQRRSRPFWFDGRFLAARDLNREQAYFLSRQADLGDAAGMGVAEGLLVRAGDSATRLRIAPGHGVCVGGARVVVPPVPGTAGAQGELEVDLAELPVQAQLNAKLGIGGSPALPDSVRSGLFVLVLRPIEFTANPVGRYPTQPGEVVSANDGEVIEGTLISLIPFAEHDAQTDDHLRRSAAARQIFLGEGWRPPTNCLPLAMLHLDRNQVRWLDPWLVRRRLGDARSDPLGLGGTPRPAREAFLVQYQRQLDTLLAERAGRRQPARFSASEHFHVLPPAGPLPVASVSADGDTLVQHFFPVEMDVDLAVVPEDELAAVVAESFLLPPIELTGPGDELAATSVLVLLPVPRATLRGMPRTPLPIKRPVVAERVALRPTDLLAGIRFPTGLPALVTRPAIGTVAEGQVDLGGPDAAVDVARWRALLAGARMLWYVRRRNLAYKDSLTGLGRQVFPDEATQEEALRASLREWGMIKTFHDIESRSTTAAKNALVQGLITSGAHGDELIARATLNSFKGQARIDQAVVEKAVSAVSDTALPELLKRVQDAVLEPETKADGTPIKAAVERNRVAREKLADVTTLGNLATIVRTRDAGSFDSFAAELKEALRTKPSADVGALVAERAGLR